MIDDYNNGGNSLHFDSDGDNSAQTIKSGPGDLHKMHIINPNGTAAYVQLFDELAANVTVGTTVPRYVALVPAGPAGGTIEDFDRPIHFDKAITYACTTTSTGSGDPATGLNISAVYV